LANDKNITTLTGITGNDQTYTDVTGTTAGNKRALDVALTGGAIPSNYDDVVLTYTGENLTTVVFKLAAVTLVTLTLTYTGSQLDRVQYS
jgi:hypothetical protein